jgi:hypothetical protein
MAVSTSSIWRPEVVPVSGTNVVKSGRRITGLHQRLGSDLATMETLTGPDQAFHGRAVDMMLGELSPADIARMTGLAGMDAFDAYLITGGQPLVAQEWEHGHPPRAFVARSFERSTSALVVAGPRVLDAEFPIEAGARAVLTAIGGRGERGYTAIARTAGVSATTLDRTLDILTAWT